VKQLLLAPPQIVIDADLAWLLRAAFAAPLSGIRPADAARALHLARATQLSGRVAKRLEAWRETSQLGELGRELAADYYANVAREALLIRAQSSIAALGERLGVPIIALKFAGLRLAQVIAPGARVASDLDLLLPEANAKQFWRALLGIGFARTNTHEYAHQLEALVDPDGAVVDLHVHIPGVSIEKRGFADADQLLARRLVRRTSSGLLVPDAALLCAHAIAHALLQNRATPQTYSPLRMIADIVDLRRMEPTAVSLATKYLAPGLRGTCETLDRLSSALLRGTFEGHGFDGTSEQTMLRHCIAARTDFAYSERLRASGLRNKLSDGASAKEIALYVADLLYPAEPALDALYGPVVGRRALFLRRLRRPIDLAVRAAQRWARSR
jgi:Uncharacterised nucleotidyltransferase